MGRTESSATWIGQNVPAAGSRFEFEDFELEDLAQAYGAHPPTFMSTSFTYTVSHSRDACDAQSSATSPRTG